MTRPEIDPRMLRGARAWARRAGALDPATVEVAGVAPVTGGTQSTELSRFEVRARTPAGTRSAVLAFKGTWHAELAALRAVATMRPCPALPVLLDGGDTDPDPSGLARGHPLAAAWIVTPLYPGRPVAGDADLPAVVFDALARLHAHHLGRAERLDGIVRISPAWFADLCRGHLTDALTAQTDRRSAAAVDALLVWLAELADDQRVAAALGALPRTLLHGDLHRGNVVVDGDRAAIIDWANARVGPALVDLANVAGRRSAQLAAYLRRFAALTGADAQPDLVEVGYWYATVQVNTQYLAAGLRYRGPDAALAMRDRARTALIRLGDALAGGGHQ